MNRLYLGVNIDGKVHFHHHVDFSFRIFDVVYLIRTITFSFPAADILLNILQSL
jgi:hypothetical protein